MATTKTGFGVWVGSRWYSAYVVKVDRPGECLYQGIKVGKDYLLTVGASKSKPDARWFDKKRELTSFINSLPGEYLELKSTASSQAQ